MPDINGNDGGELEEQYEIDKHHGAWDKWKHEEFDRFMEEYVDTHWDELQKKFEEWLDNEAEKQWELRTEAWYS
jgi:hypothetical protein